MPAITIYCFLKTILITVVCSTELRRLQYRDVIEVSYESCIVAIPEKLAQAQEGKALSLISSAAAAFRSEPKVSFYLLDFSDVTGFNETISQIDLENGFTVFELMRKDRSCLLTPRRAIGNLKPKVYLFKRDSDYNVDKIINFINQKCLTFRKADSNLTPQGIHEEYILNNLFSISKKTRSHNADGSRASTSSSGSEQFGEGGDDSFCAASSNYIKENNCATLSVSANVSPHSQPKPTIVRHCEKISVPTSSTEFLNDYVSLSKPVIITGVTSDWPVFKKWKNRYLKEQYGEIKVHIKITPNGEYEGVEPSDLWENKSKVKIPHTVLSQLPFPDLVVVRPATMEIKFSEFIDLIDAIASSKNSNISAYLEYSSISYFPDLEKDIAEMSFIDGVLDLKHTNVWLSDGNTVGKLHFDPYDNFMCQISGEKEFILYDPHENERLYEAHIQEAILSYNKSTKKFSREKLMESTSMVMSPVDIEKPDLKRFPDFANAEPMSCKIQPGEVLFTPAFWWHEVRSKPNETEHRNLAVNFWYDPFFLKEFPCAECRLYVNPKYFHLL